MPVSAGEFNEWLERESLTTSASALAAATGINRSTLKNQMRRGSVLETTVIEVCRAYGRSPVEALSAFAPYRNLAATAKPPLSEEIISQIHLVDLVSEYEVRTSKAHAQRQTPRLPLVPFPHDGSVRAWLDAVDPGDIRKFMMRETGIVATNIALQLGDNRLTPALAIAASTAAQVSSVSGFVVTGLLAPSEAQWPTRAREDALLGMSDLQLLEAMAYRIHRLKRKITNRDDALEHASDLATMLG